MPLTLTELLPDEDYRFHMTLRKGRLGDFFSSPDPVVLAERRRWISQDPVRFTAATEASAAAVTELGQLAPLWSGISVSNIAEGAVPVDRVKALGASMSADFMLLARDRQGVFRLQAGAVCFPSSWALEDKMGRTLDDIHGHVPGLNPAIGPSIGQFLDRLKPDAPFERANWGLAATAELNLHPSLGRPRLVAPVDLSRTWLRIEDQIFASLPASGAILFGIHIRVLPFAAISGDARLRSGFRRAVATMSEPLADYKGLAEVRALVLAGALD